MEQAKLRINSHASLHVIQLVLWRWCMGGGVHKCKLRVMERKHAFSEMSRQYSCCATKQFGYYTLGDSVTCNVARDS